MLYPQITVVTPSFNQGNFLEQTINSVINQNYPNLEYIIIDGGSDDDSVAIIKKYSNHLSYWRSVKDKGQSDAIHYGFTRASGDLLIWLNSDDCFMPGALINAANFYKKNPNVDILLGDIIYSDMEGNLTKYYRYTKPRKYFARHGIIAFGQQSMFMSSSFYNNSGGIRIDFHYCMDTEFVYRALKNNAIILVMHEIVGVFRWHEDMKSKLVGGRKEEEQKYIRNKYNRATKISSIYRLFYVLLQTFNGNYFMSFLKSLKLKNNSLKSIWHRALKD